MSVRDDLRKQVTQAMKSDDSVRKNLLRTVIGEIQRMEAKKALSDDQSIRVIRKMKEYNLETIEILRATDESSQEKIATLEAEIRILEEFIPQTLSVDEIISALKPIEDEIKSFDKEGPAIGKAISFLKKQGALVSGEDVSSAICKIKNKSSMSMDR